MTIREETQEILNRAQDRILGMKRGPLNVISRIGYY